MRLLVLALFFPAFALAQKAEINVQSGAAIRGYDPVAYHRELQPIKGSEEFTANWKGAVWRFSSARNRDLFKAEPEKYARNTAATAPTALPAATPWASIRTRGAWWTASST